MHKLFVAIFSLVIATTAMAADKPNVLFIAVDDLNHWVHYLDRNSQSATPNIDRLAMRGVRFSRSYCAAPVCNPSRAALMSGLRPGTTGVYENNNDWRTVLPEEQMLTTAFRKGETELVIIITPYFVEGSNSQLQTPLTGRVPPTDVDRLVMQRFNHPTPPRRLSVGHLPIQGVLVHLRGRERG